MEVAKKPEVKGDIEARVFEAETPQTYSACLRTGEEYDDEEK